MGKDFIKSANKSIDPQEIHTFLVEMEKKERRRSCETKWIICPYYGRCLY